MARISRDEYPRIQHLVNVEGKKVAEVAASYGCTPANIYAILNNKTRRLGGEASTQADLQSPVAPVLDKAEAPLETPLAVVTCSDRAPPADLFADLPEQAAPRQTDPVGTDDLPASREPAASVEHASMAEVPAPETRAEGPVATLGSRLQRNVVRCGGRVFVLHIRSYPLRSEHHWRSCCGNRPNGPGAGAKAAHMSQPPEVAAYVVRMAGWTGGRTPGAPRRGALTSPPGERGQLLVPAHGSPVDGDLDAAGPTAKQAGSSGRCCRLVPTLFSRAHA